MLWKVGYQGIRLIKKVSIEDLSGGVIAVKGSKFLIGSDCMGKMCALDIFTGKCVKEIDLSLEPVNWLFLNNEKKIIVSNRDNQIYSIQCD